MVSIQNRISTAVIYSKDVVTTRIAYLTRDGHIMGNEYDSSLGSGTKQQFPSIEAAKSWVHEIAPVDAVFGAKDAFSGDHYDNVSANRKSFEKMWRIHNEPDSIVQLLNGSETYFSKTVGYCAYHKRYITSQQLKTKKCLTKNCNRLIKIENKFWESRDEVQISKRLKKALEI